MKWIGLLLLQLLLLLCSQMEALILQYCSAPSVFFFCLFKEKMLTKK